MFENCKAQQQDLKQVQLLWKKTFLDDESFIKQNLKNFVGYENIYIAKKGNEVLACLCAVPCEINQKQGAYFYALATKKEFKANGIMSGLMLWTEEQLKQQGLFFCALIPASDVLFEFYEKRGYTNKAFLREIEQKITSELFAYAEFDVINAKKFCELRKTFLLHNCLNFNVASVREIIANLYADGASTAITNDGYAVFFENHKEIFIPEIFATDEESAAYLLRAINNKTGVGKMKITLAKQQKLWLGLGEIKPFALLKKLDENFKICDWHVRLAMEEYV